ncbi:MAG: LytR/AlgR family response regulator transcription factor [Chitinophagaceae bacterium]
MKKLLIIEDEIPARQKLKRFIQELNIPIIIVAEIGSVDAAVAFLQQTKVDVIISDIELQDGNVFEVYEKVNVNCPIIFTTAYNQFWMNAFETNGIDYLLKPFSQERFQKAWDKLLLLQQDVINNNELYQHVSKLIQMNIVERNYKKQFTIHTHKGIHFLEISDIVFFEASEGVVFAFDVWNKKHVLNYATLKEVEQVVHPTAFFRINRSELIHKMHIEKIERSSKNYLSVRMKGYHQMLISSQSNTAALRDWIDA